MYLPNFVSFVFILLNWPGFSDCWHGTQIELGLDGRYAWCKHKHASIMTACQDTVFWCDSKSSDWSMTLIITMNNLQKKQNHLSNNSSHVLQQKMLLPQQACTLLHIIALYH